MLDAASVPVGCFLTGLGGGGGGGDGDTGGGGGGDGWGGGGQRVVSGLPMQKEHSTQRSSVLQWCRSLLHQFSHRIGLRSFAAALASGLHAEHPLHR